MNSGSTYLGHLPAFVCTYPTPTVRGPGEPSIQPRTYRYVPIEAQSRLSLYSRMFIISISISSLRSIYPSQPHDFRTLFHTLPRSLSVPNSASKPVPLPCPALPCRPTGAPARAPHGCCFAFDLAGGSAPRFGSVGLGSGLCNRWVGGGGSVRRRAMWAS